MVPREVWYKGFQREENSRSPIELEISPELLEGVYLNIKKICCKQNLNFRDRWCFCWPGTAENVQIRTKSAPEKTSPPPTTKSSGEVRNDVLRGLHGLYIHGKINFDEKYFFIMEKKYFEKIIFFRKIKKFPKVQKKTQNFQQKNQKISEFSF